MARRLLLLVLLGLVPAGVALGAKPTSWAAAEIRAARPGPDDLPRRRHRDPRRARRAPRRSDGPPIAIAKPEVPLTMQDLDARLVAALGLATEAKAFTDAAKAAGLAPPSRFGTEAVARLLGSGRTIPRRTTRSSGSRPNRLPAPRPPSLPHRSPLPAAGSSSGVQEAAADVRCSPP